MKIRWDKNIQTKVIKPDGNYQVWNFDKGDISYVRVIESTPINEFSMVSLVLKGTGTAHGILTRDFTKV